MLDSRALCPLTTVSFRLPNRGNELILMSRLDLCYILFWMIFVKINYRVHLKLARLFILYSS